MSDKTPIEWTDATWNPIRAKGDLGRWYCQKISPGCDHCYASRLNKRFGGKAYAPVELGALTAARQAVADGDIYLDEKTLAQPVHWKRPRRVFVCSMTDLFGEWVSDDWLLNVWLSMAVAGQHTFQVLTKRPSRMKHFLDRIQNLPGGHQTFADSFWPLPNVWLGVSVESDAYTWRAKALAEIPAAVRFVSAEPLLGPLPGLDLSSISWLIAGSESGPGARACELNWVRLLRDKSQAAGTAFFWKQAAVNGHKISTPELDGRRWMEYPEVANA